MADHCLVQTSPRGISTPVHVRTTVMLLKDNVERSYVLTVGINVRLLARFVDYHLEPSQRREVVTAFHAVTVIAFVALVTSDAPRSLSGPQEAALLVACVLPQLV